MARINLHHIIYKPVEWLVELNAQMHRVITTIQITKASPEKYAMLTNFVHAIVYEWNRMRQELDSEIKDIDLRTVKPKRRKKKEKKIRKKIKK